MEERKKAAQVHSVSCNISPLRGKEEELSDDLKIFFMKRGYKVAYDRYDTTTKITFLNFVKEK